MTIVDSDVTLVFNKNGSLTKLYIKGMDIPLNQFKSPQDVFNYVTFEWRNGTAVGEKAFTYLERWCMQTRNTAL